RGAEHDAVARENLRKTFGHDRLNTPSNQTLRRVLPGRSAAEIAVRNQDGCALIRVSIERMVLLPAVRIEALVEEWVVSHLAEGNLLQKPRRNNPVRVDVVADHRHRPALYALYFGHSLLLFFWGDFPPLPKPSRLRSPGPPGTQAAGNLRT